MTPKRQRAFYLCAGLSLVCSILILSVALFAPSVPQLPLFAANWLAFACASFLGLQPGLTWFDRRMARKDHWIFRIILLAFTGSGLTAAALGARIV